MDFIYVGTTVLFFVLCGWVLGLFGTRAAQNGREG
jgi:hypothetical protein